MAPIEIPHKRSHITFLNRKLLLKPSIAGSLVQSSTQGPPLKRVHWRPLALHGPCAGKALAQRITVLGLEWHAYPLKPCTPGI
eukprot:4019863-Pyramimonas_sp.AAC.1